MKSRHVFLGFIPIIVLVLAFGFYLDYSISPAGNYTSYNTQSTEQQFPYCTDPSSALAAANLLPKIHSLPAFIKAEGDYSTWVLYATSTQSGSESGNGTVTYFNNIEIIFFPLGNSSVYGALTNCSEIAISEYLYLFVPGNPDGSYNWNNATPNVEAAPQCVTTTLTLSNSTTTARLLCS